MAATTQFFTSMIPWFEGKPAILVSLVEMCIILVITMIASVIEMIVYHRLYRRFRSLHRLWDDILLFAIHRPLQLVILAIGVSYCVEVFDSYFPNTSLFTLTVFVRRSIIVLSSIWAAFRFAKFLERSIRSGEKNMHVDKATAFALNRLFKVLIFFIGSIAVFQLIGVPISALVAFGGTGALAFSFAVKDTLANVFGGLMLYIEKPFSVDDWISVIGKNIEGTVLEIGWRSTKIINFDKRPMFIPNSVFTTSTVMNCTRMSHRRLLATVSLRYQDNDKVKIICDEILAYLAQHKDIDQTQTSKVSLDQFADSSINVQVICFTRLTASDVFVYLKQEVYLAIMDIVKKHGADFAFPTQTLDMPSAVTINQQA